MVFPLGVVVVLLVVVGAVLLGLRAVAQGANPGLLMGLGGLLVGAGAVGVLRQEANVSELVGVALITAGLVIGVIAVVDDAKTRSGESLVRND